MVVTVPLLLLVAGLASYAAGLPGFVVDEAPTTAKSPHRTSKNKPGNSLAFSQGFHHRYPPLAKISGTCPTSPQEQPGTL